MFRIATAFNEEEVKSTTKTNFTTQANAEALKLLINLTAYGDINTELVNINAPVRLAEFIVQEAKQVPVKEISKVDDESLESSIVVLANLTRYVIGIKALLQEGKPEAIMVKEYSVFYRVCIFFI